MKPILPGYQIGEFIGEGACGKVWVAEDPVGNLVAVRTLNALAVNLDLVREVGRRLHGTTLEGHGPIPIWLQALDLKPAMEVTPLIGDFVEGRIFPRNLQARLSDYMATAESEAVVKCLAKALASLHRCQVVHGNLKPGNVFISEEGRILVGDYGLGWMPGIDAIEFSDAVLYMAPEQLKDPTGLYREAGYRWDVFAFGVLAYRLLEGVFPRCQEVFGDVAPDAGVLHQEGIEANLEEVSEGLANDEVRPWEGKHDEALKKIIERCLSLDPEERFRDMVELCEVWERETLLSRHAVEMEVVARKLRHGRRWKRGLSWGVAASLTLGTISGVGWFTREHLLARKVEDAQSRTSFAEKSKEVAEEERDRAQAADAALKVELEEAEKNIVQLSESRKMLLEWAFAEGGDELPVLVGRKGRLELLDQEYQELISGQNRSKEDWVEGWQEERALLALLRNQPEMARDLVSDEVSRLGSRGLTLLLLKESTKNEVSREDLALARTLVKRVKGEEEPWLQSVLDLVEVRNFELAGQGDRALRLLAEVGEKMSQLPTVDLGTVSVWRTRLQREAADVAEGVGREKLAAEFRAAMVKGLDAELALDGLEESLRKKLKGYYVIAAEGLAENKYSQGQLSEARLLAEKSLSLGASETEPRVKMALAVHHAVIGGCYREEGKVEKAQEELEKGLGLLEQSFAEASDERWREYRQGVLKWQLAGTVGQLGKPEKELKLGQEALAMMRELLSQKGVRPSAIQIHRVVGYLSGDLAQGYESRKNEKMRNELLDEAIESWKFLRAANPEEPEYVAGLAWCESLRDE